MNEIIPGVYLGDVNSARRLPTNINKVVNCARELGNVARVENYLHLNLEDTGTMEDNIVFYQI